MDEPPPAASLAASSRLRRYWLDVPLWARIIPALALGIAVGLILGEGAAGVRWLGDIFVRLTRMLMAPLVFFTIAAGVVALADPKRLGALGTRVLGLYVGTAAVAAALGLALGLVLQPGAGVDLSGVIPLAIKPSRPLGEQLMGVIPLNPIQALAEGDMLAVIFFAACVGSAVLSLGPRAQPIADVLRAGSEVMLQLIRGVIELAPLGVFGLVAAAVGSHGAGVFLHVGLLAAGTLVGSAVLSLIIQPLLVRLLARRPALGFQRDVVDAGLVAFSTSSSSASLPIELVVAERKLGIGATIRNTVLPMGVSLGRDGTALFVALVSLFAAQALGVDLSPGDLVLIVAVSTLLAVSCPPVPSASLFMMAAVLSVIGISDAYAALVVGFILPFDRPLDMLRTVPNVIGNLTNATIIARWAGDLDAGAGGAPARPAQ